MRRRVTRSLIIGLCVLFVLSMGVAFFLRSKQAQYKGEKVLKGLNQDVEVLFDKWAIPHIYANNQTDAYRALGYLHAQDRLFQMEMMRRLAKGELAEVLGPELLKFDKLFRTLGIRTIADNLAKKNAVKSGHVADVFKAYLSGINLFIQEGSTPIEFQILGMQKRPFDESDSFAISAYMAFSFVKSLQTDPLMTYVHEHLPAEFKADLLPKHQNSFSYNSSHDADLLKTLNLYAHSLISKNPFAEFEGSNAWVVSGARTRSGKPILANDPHIGFSAPSVWYEASIESPDLKLYGHYLAGVPVALLGHTDFHGWGVTMLQNKDSDFYKETLNPDNSEQVWFKDHWENMLTSKEWIKVKGQDDVSLVIRSTRHGPIINAVVEGFKNYKDPIAFLWDFANSDNGMLDAFYGLARAKNVSDAEASVKKIVSPGLNIMYADAAGDIAWWTAARFPIRPEHIKDKFLLDGSTGLDEYLGYYSFESHPHSVNPEEGFIVTANHDSFAKHTYEIPGYYNPDFRYDTIVKHLNSKSSAWTVEDMKTIQLDTHNEIYARILSRILPIIEKTVKSETDAKAFELLKNWDFSHPRESQAATIFHEFIGQLVQKVFEERLTHSFYDSMRRRNFIQNTILSIVENSESPWWKDKEGKLQYTAWIQELWNTSLQELSKVHGKNPKQWTWGRVHKVEHKHILGHSKYLAPFFNVGEYSVEGASEVVNNFYFNISPGFHEVNSGPSTRRIIDFSNPSESWGINPTGQSGYFANSHYRDQAPLFHKGEYRLQIMNRKRLQDAKRLVLRAPKGVAL